jgi:hypothetical protein
MICPSAKREIAENEVTLLSVKKISSTENHILNLEKFKNQVKMMIPEIKMKQFHFVNKFPGLRPFDRKLPFQQFKKNL